MRALSAAVVGVVLFVATALPAQAQVDPVAPQTISSEQQLASGEVELAAGHVDLGPRFVHCVSSLLVHDATLSPPVYRSVEDVVLRVGDAAQVVIPDDPTYSFVGVDAGEQVWVIPQTENPDVVWLGWNTQDPGVMERLDRGATIRLLGVDGPGDVVTYLQAGNLSGPEVVWDSREPGTPLWVDVNTHTHANWVFTEPGAYLMRVEIAADLDDGSSVASVADVRVAVGDAVSVDEAFDAAFEGDAAAPASATEVTAAALPAESSESSGQWWLAGLAAAIVVLLVVGVRATQAQLARRAVRSERGDVHRADHGARR